MSRRHRQKQRRRIRLHLNFRSLLPFVVIGMSCRLLSGGSALASASAPASSSPNVANEEDTATGDTFQTVNVPLSPLQLRIDGKLHTDVEELDKAKEFLTHAFFRLLRSHYGACLDHVNLQLSLEQAKSMPSTVTDQDENGRSSDGTAVKSGDETAKQQQDRNEAILIAEATATLHCKTVDMPALSIKDIDEIIGRSNDTFHHVASIVFTSPSSSDNLYHSLVRIAFNASDSRGLPTSLHSNGDNADPITISSNRKLDVDDKDSSDTSTRALESEVTCVPQVSGRVKLMRGEFICSTSLEYSFGLTQKGDLSLLRNGETIWSVSAIVLLPAY